MSGGTTINISGSNNDSNLVLGSSGASIIDNNSLPVSSVTPNVPNLSNIDLSEYNPLSISNNCIGGYSKLLFPYSSDTSLNVVYEGVTKTIEPGANIYLTLILDKLVCVGGFSLSLDPYDVSGRLYQFPKVYAVNYTSLTDSSCVIRDTCTFYNREQFKYVPDWFLPEFSYALRYYMGAMDFDLSQNPMVQTFYEQGICSDLSSTTGKFETFTPKYFYNFTPDSSGVNTLANIGVLTSISTPGWYQELGDPLSRYYA